MHNNNEEEHLGSRPRPLLLCFSSFLSLSPLSPFSLSLLSRSLSFHWAAFLSRVGPRTATMAVPLHAKLFESKLGLAECLKLMEEPQPFQTYTEVRRVLRLTERGRGRGGGRRERERAMNAKERREREMREFVVLIALLCFHCSLSLFLPEALGAE